MGKYFNFASFLADGLNGLLPFMSLMLLYFCVSSGMNAAVRAVARMGIYVGCRVFLINEVSMWYGFIQYTSNYVALSGPGGGPALTGFPW